MESLKQEFEGVTSIIYKVLDLGVNQKSQDIIDEAIKNNADIIALSSMMTTTMENMRLVTPLSLQP